MISCPSETACVSHHSEIRTGEFDHTVSHIVIGASNREDMIDPAILRPGRLDVKIKIERPDAQAAGDILSKYLTSELPLHPDDLVEHGGSADATCEAMIRRTVERMYVEPWQDTSFSNVVVYLYF